MEAEVMVFAPVPQLTITIEQIADDTELHVHAGGQGIWQARMIAELGVSVTLCAAIGGEVGTVLEPLMAGENIRVRTVHRDSANGWYIHDRRDGERNEVAAHHGAPLGRHELDEVYTLALAEGLRAGMAVLSGPADPSVAPPEAYQRLATDLTGNGVRVIADLSGEHLSAVVPGRPVLVKVSDEEVGAEDEKQAVEALRRLHDEGAEAVIISRADKPALAYVDGDVLRIRMPQLAVKEHRGAGDSMTAAAVSVLAHGGDMLSAIRAGAAAGTLNVTRHGLGTGRSDAIEELAKRVELEKL
jgi:1-phosphofructokinase